MENLYDALVTKSFRNDVLAIPKLNVKNRIRPALAGVALAIGYQEDLQEREWDGDFFDRINR
ncbi:MAG: hypothetical protein WCG52_11045, partial [bacterium]